MGRHDGTGATDRALAHDPQLERQLSAQAFDDLLQRLRAEADSPRALGNAFEDLVRAYLTTDPVMSRQFARVYSWREWPGRDHRPDTGIDLVAIEHAHMPADGVVGPDTPATAIQCKAYGSSRVSKADIDSFISASSSPVFTRRLFVDTSGHRWGKNAEETLADLDREVTRISLDDLRISAIDWRSYPVGAGGAQVCLQERKMPRDHQTRAVNDVLAGMEAEERGTLVMACGTGKTYTSLLIAQELVAEDHPSARVLFLVPSLALMAQTLEAWSTDASVPLTAWSVCSDHKVNRRRAKADDIADIAAIDLKLPPTTDPGALAASMRAAEDNEGLQVVFATYQSLDIVHRAQELGIGGEGEFDLVIADEAHRTTGVTLAGEDSSTFVRVHDPAYIRAAKRLYMTATPRIFNDRVKHVAQEKDAVLASMDDVATFGRVFHRLGFGQAVAEGLLTDYKVVVLAIPEDQMTQICQAAAAEDGELSLPDAAKLVGCWNALAKRKNGVLDVSYGADSRPMRRAVAFVDRVKTSRHVAEQFPWIVSEHLQDLDNDDETDNLAVECRHVDGTMNAIERGEALAWLKDTPEIQDTPVCRILTNARCLSEGVDVPTLDAVLFLNPRKSQVDVIQAVGRVMRRAEGKEFGYIILPVAVPSGSSPEQALNDNKRFAVVWQVLQAIRAHDERFDATVNAIEYNAGDPQNIVVDVVNLAKPQQGGNQLNRTAPGDDEPGPEGPQPRQLAMVFPPAQWKDAIYSRIVKKVGSRMYWDDWSADIGDIASRYITLITHLLESGDHAEAFDEFLASLQATLNPGIDRDQAIEMLAQHLITKPLFDAMFPDQTFTEMNPVSRAMQAILDKLASSSQFDTERAPLEGFYATMTERIRAIDSLSGKQQIMVTLYDKFFSKAFPSLRDRLGIVFTPVEVVDYILRSANDALELHFGKRLADEGVAIIEPFLGTGTFVTRLLQSGLIPPAALERKYTREIFANEIVLLSYYIASINIEQVYREVRREAGYADEYVEFPGISLTDTFQLHENDGQIAGLGDFAANAERARRQKEAPIRVVVMNPPYSAGQRSANDNNQNLKYERLDGRIADTYAARSTGQNKNGLYDSYYRALRWAADRIGEEGVIAFVSNNAFIDGNSADGVRLSWQEEFSDIYVYNLKGNQRTQGERSRQEGGKVFGSGSRTGVAVAVLVKKREHSGPATIHYVEVDDYLTRQQKLDCLVGSRSLARTTFEEITPNEHGDWINQRDERYAGYQPIGDKATKGKETTPGIFRQYSRGLETSRDAWCYNYSRAALEANMSRTIHSYNEQLAAGERNFDPREVAWSSSLERSFARGVVLSFNKRKIRASSYRPFCVQNVYFDNRLNHRPYQLPQLFPTPGTPNVAFGVTGDYRKPWSLLVVDRIPDLNLLSATTFFPLYTWEKIGADGAGEPTLLDLAEAPEAAGAEFSGVFDFARPIGEQVPLVVDGYRRRDAITDATLAAYRDAYADASIAKEDVFFYIYALLHHPEYRSRYEADLKKGLPRIPMCAGFADFAAAGRKLADLHVNYERQEPHASVRAQWALTAPEDPWARYRLDKLAWGGSARSRDYTTLVYNDHLTFTGIPETANDYRVGGRSPLEWMVDRYKVTVDKKSQIRNDPNDWCRDLNDPAYIAGLVPRLVTVSLRTQEIVAALPALAIKEDQEK